MEGHDMRILVTGATGYLGRHIVKQLAREHYELVLTSRREHAGEDGYDWRCIDYATAQTPEVWGDIVENIDIAINAVGIFQEAKRQTFEALHDKGARALFEACQDAGVKRIIQISALGTDETATSDYHLSKKRADDALVHGAENGSSLEWVILRPSLIIGEDGESWRLFKALAALPVVPVIGDGRQPLQPVVIEDVVKAVLEAVNRPDAAGCRINLVGDECLSLENYLQMLSRWMEDRTFCSIHIPYGLAGPLAMAGQLCGELPLNRAAISMLREARIFEGEDCKRKLGFEPRGVSEFLKKNQSHHHDRLTARLYFLGPVLRLSLAFMWVMAGVVSIFFYPEEQSLSLLAMLGITGSAGVAALYGAAVLDMLLGLALLVKYQIKTVAMVQIGVIVFYTLVLSWIMPALWADPFGALVKNIPIIIATMMMWATEE